MGHKGGHSFSGALGRRDPLMPSSPMDALQEQAEEQEARDIRELAREHDREAVRTLAILMKSRKTPPNVRRQCAKDLIEIGYGRVTDRQAQQAESGGLTINIVQLTSGDVERVNLPRRAEKVIKDMGSVSEAEAELAELLDSPIEVSPAQPLDVKLLSFEGTEGT